MRASAAILGRPITDNGRIMDQKTYGSRNVCCPSDDWYCEKSTIAMKFQGKERCGPRTKNFLQLSRSLGTETRTLESMNQAVRDTLPLSWHRRSEPRRTALPRLICSPQRGFLDIHLGHDQIGSGNFSTPLTNPDRQRYRTPHQLRSCPQSVGVVGYSSD